MHRVTDALKHPNNKIKLSKSFMQSLNLLQKPSLIIKRFGMLKET